MIRGIFIYDRARDFVRRRRDHIRYWLSGLMGYLSGRGYEVIVGHSTWRRNRTYDYLRRRLDRCVHAFIWNGALSHYDQVKEACTNTGVPYTIAEVGWFPQREFYHLDSVGINASSSLMHSDLSWVNERILASFDAFASRYLQGRRWRRRNGYVLCPLQLESDTNITVHSPFSDMQKFIDHVEHTYSNERVLFKAHPLNRNGRYRTRKPILRAGDFLTLAQDASQVVGINSTCLLEATMLGVPTKALGNGLLRRHMNNRHKLLAALVDRQIPVGAKNLDYWLNPVLKESQ